MKIETALSYDNIYLRPNFSTLESRDYACTQVTNFGLVGSWFNLPVIPSNMQDVINPDIAIWLSNNNYFYIMHRFEGMTPKFIRECHDKVNYLSVSVGVKDLDAELGEAIRNNYMISYITIDVAHAHHKLTEKAVQYIRKYFDNAYLIAGNVATGTGVKFLNDLGVDTIKVGIGGGSICTTKNQTGFHIPTLQSVYEAKQYTKLPIIADGGAKEFGDIAKAISFGATMVMAGSWFASCIDSPASVVHGRKIYRGSTSYAAKGHERHVEGTICEVAPTVTYAEQMRQIQEALQSSISYAGGKDLSALRDCGWVRVVPS